ncbi:flavin monoamine oxidase family protein [Lacihabitans lacunae]|uniref:Flavin monoamine oxidase family protein n=1 Tax=Lacihabitans lacunae TaxID=1028214 RepID=A0ABV7YXN7_9BACT
MEEIIIIGGGISGLTTAYYLQKNNIPFVLLEAQNRLGGRIDTVLGKNQTPIEMGATWFSDAHQNLIGLLNELEIPYFQQFTEGNSFFQSHSFIPPQVFFTPQAKEASYRVKDGTQAIIEKIAATIPSEKIKLDTKVIKIADKADFIELTDNDGNLFQARKIVSTIPPQILAESVEFAPTLPKEVSNLMANVQTWMSGSIKFSLEYSEAFWRKNGFSGTIYSQSGMAVEVYDHSNFENDKFALTGFLNGSAAIYSPQQREEIVSGEIKKLFGPETPEYLSYTDKIWDNEFISIKNPIALRAHQNNGHPYLLESYFNNKLHLAGTETDTHFPGYLDGAVASAMRVFGTLSS